MLPWQRPGAGEVSPVFLEVCPHEEVAAHVLPAVSTLCGAHRRELRTQHRHDTKRRSTLTQITKYISGDAPEEDGDSPASLDEVQAAESLRAGHGHFPEICECLGLAAASQGPQRPEQKEAGLLAEWKNKVSELSRRRKDTLWRLGRGRGCDCVGWVELAGTVERIRWDCCKARLQLLEQATGSTEAAHITINGPEVSAITEHRLCCFCRSSKKSRTSSRSWASWMWTPSTRPEA